MDTAVIHVSPAMLRQLDFLLMRHFGGTVVLINVF